MCKSWIVDPDPVISLDLAEILMQHFGGAAPRVFETPDEALNLCDTLPALAILRVQDSRDDKAMQALIARLSEAAVPLVLLGAAPGDQRGETTCSVALPFSSDDIVAALNALFGAMQRPSLRKDPR